MGTKPPILVEPGHSPKPFVDKLPSCRLDLFRWGQEIGLALK